MEIHNRLLVVRKNLDKRQLEFAEELGVSGTAYKTYEKGSQVVPTSILLQLAERYSISPNWLLLGIGGMRNEPPTHLVVSAIQAARAVIDEFDFKPDPDQEVQLICKMFEQRFTENDRIDSGHTDLKRTG
ncbi:helix-turn-helix domain-containing protein [Pseudovibrio sp. WM33]|uniref:helix-turn-helix domain-containing protein n=1 Tax=Pseudovibrio sp. WM33 TaxID=1735585 RepID=UPI0007AEBF93|nr:helix-turn-helix transcriptional regulator [Pseudovibrio sp. WM33]KZL24707.1 transcriptional repressor DicA [Pseudovibrio sp. WM33]